jgi:predicted Rossmann fold flavoprotein
MRTYDVAVIGGGPAGMMAAGRAAELGAKVVLIEKNLKLGRKLLLTGNGRCNLTQAEFEVPALIAQYGPGGKFLFSAFSAFGPKEVMDFFEGRGIALKVEPGNRVFPKSDRAPDVLDALLAWMREGGVELQTDSPVKSLVREGDSLKYVHAGDEGIQAGAFIIATGGKSYPETGSTGDGYSWLKELGHAVVEPRPALVPVRVREKWVSRLMGLSVEKVEVSAEQKGKKRAAEQGDLMFTHFGLSGPAALNLSRAVGELLKSGEVKIIVDLLPESKVDKADADLLAFFSAAPNKVLKNALGALFAPRLAESLCDLCGIDPEKRVNRVSREERRKIAQLSKRLEMAVSSLLGFDKAMVSAGGVDLKEIDPQTMRSKIVRNLFIAGELLNLAGPTGGYNLQLCWATGYLAGSACLPDSR